MIHLSGARGVGANHARRSATRYRVARCGCPSSDVSRPLLPESPPKGAPGTDGVVARTGAGVGSISIWAGGASDARAGASAAGSERTTDGGAAGGASAALGAGALGGGTALGAGAVLGAGV